VYSIQFYVPDSHLELIKAAMFAAGAGKIGNYDSCAWQTEGVGQFRPLEGSQAFIGKTGQLEKIKEWKVEMVCENSILDSVIEALKKAHPYQTPAYVITRHEE
jgi:hypothetical protein